MEWSLRKDASERPLRRMPSFHQLRLVLLALGVSALALALTLGLLSVLTGNPTIKRIAFFYVPLAAGCLLLRQLLVWVKRRRKRSMRKRRSRHASSTDSAGFT